jgi:hypothetical protein
MVMQDMDECLYKSEGKCHHYPSLSIIIDPSTFALTLTLGLVFSSIRDSIRDHIVCDDTNSRIV